MKYVLFIIGCILLFGASTFLRKMALERMHPFQFQIVSGIIYTAFIPIWYYLLSSKENVQYYPINIFWAIACTLLYMTGAILFGFLLKENNSVGTAAALVSLNPVITLGLSFVFLGEKLTVAKCIAFVLALTSAILINF